MALQRNTLYNLASVVIPTLVTLLTTPLYLQLIGEARYGVMALVWVLLGYFGLSDLGLGPALARQLACQRGEDCKSLIHCALLSSLALGLLGGLSLWGLGLLGLHAGLFSGPHALEPEISSALWLSLPLVPVVTLSSVFSGALQGRERFLALNLCNTLTAVGALLLPLLLAWCGLLALPWLLGAVLLARLLTLLLALKLVECSWWPLQPAWHELRGLLQVGGWLALSNVLSVVMNTTDRSLIAGSQGVQAVTWYGIPFNLLTRVTLLPVSLMGALFPRLSAADDAQRQHLALLSLRGICWLMLPLVMTGICLLQPFLDLWLGEDFRQRALLAGLLLLPGIWMNSLAQVPYYQLQAAGHTARLLRIHLLELPFYILALLLGLQLWGVAGAALAWSLRVALDAVLMLSAASLLKQTVPLTWLPLLLVLGGLSLVLLASSNWLLLLLWLAGIWLMSAHQLWQLKSALCSGTTGNPA